MAVSFVRLERVYHPRAASLPIPELLGYLEAEFSGDTDLYD
jgi:hypothetical protein